MTIKEVFVMNDLVIVVNADYTFLSSINWQRSIVLLYQNKAEIVKEGTRQIYNTSKSYSYVVPKIIRLVKYVTQIFKSKIPYSKGNVFIRDRFTCQYCKKKLTHSECTVDHVTPKARGGKSTWENCVTSCKKCNGDKGDMHLKDFRYILQTTPVQPNVSEFTRIKSYALVDTLKDLW